MARPIDADAFITKYCHECKEQSEGKCLRDICGRCKIFEAVNGAPTISDKSCVKIDAHPAWIPCSERLPEIYEKVLTADRDGNVTENFRLNIKTGELEWSRGFWITHWRPMPKPPQNDRI